MAAATWPVRIKGLALDAGEAPSPLVMHFPPQRVEAPRVHLDGRAVGFVSAVHFDGRGYGADIELEASLRLDEQGKFHLEIKGI